MAKIISNRKLGIRITIHGNRMRVQSVIPRRELLEQDPECRVWIQDTVHQQRMTGSIHPRRRVSGVVLGAR